MTATVEHLSTKDVAELAGVSYRTIDHWVRTGLLPCHRPAVGSGSRREFSYHDALVARVYARLRYALTRSHQPVSDWWPGVDVSRFITARTEAELTSPDGLTIPLAGGATLHLPDLSMTPLQLALIER